MDRVRVETRVDAAVAKYGVTGSNVLIAILDRGLDWKHQDFRHPDGTTRIEYFYDMLDNTGSNAPGNPFGVGTIYTKAQINGALLGGTNLNARDAVGHGTTTTGIAAGGGRILAAYRGIAPHARLLVVKLTSDGGRPITASLRKPLSTARITSPSPLTS
jgi:minor extracellular serine protease Vpr